MSASDSHREALIAYRNGVISRLNTKLQPLPKRIFPGHRKPTLLDICKQTGTAHFLPSSCTQFDLVDYFEHYDEFARRGFQARKSTGLPNDEQIAAATWALQMDYSHQFSVFSRVVQYNALAMMMVTILQVPDDVCATAATFQFRRGFFFAIEDDRGESGNVSYQKMFLANWHTHEMDLIQWGSSKMRHLGKVSIR